MCNIIPRLLQSAAPKKGSHLVIAPTHRPFPHRNPRARAAPTALPSHFTHEKRAAAPPKQLF